MICLVYTLPFRLDLDNWVSLPPGTSSLLVRFQICWFKIFMLKKIPSLCSCLAPLSGQWMLELPLAGLEVGLAALSPQGSALTGLRLVCVPGLSCFVCKGLHSHASVSYQSNLICCLVYKNVCC